ncbi:hypothetical protein TNCV_4736661 [Trichonephila clavipes]|nr:hypothetical protein TNCV_4736661 [Trichonephila clavipes]
MKQKRVGRPRFERLPNVVPVASLTDETIWSLLFAQSYGELSLTTLETADGTSTTLALKKKYADQTLLAVLRQVPREAIPIRRYRSPSPYRRSSQSPGRRSEENKESDLPRRMGLFRGVSNRCIDCGQNELVLEDICRDSTAPDAWNLYATRDYTLKPHSLTRITVSGYQTRGE